MASRARLGRGVFRRCRSLRVNLQQVQSTAAPVTVLTGDIGGTNARLSVWSCHSESGLHKEVYHKTFPTSDFAEFDSVLQEFLSEKEVVECGHVAGAALAVAGAVESNRCAMTNITWVIDGAAVQDKFGFRCAVLNDFEAVGYGIPALPDTDIVALNPAPVTPKAPKAVMGPGTGLGAAQLFWDNSLGGYRVMPGEGAHATFAPRGWRQSALAAWVTARLGHCEIEEVACGRGLALIYEFLLSDNINIRPEERENLKKTPPEITMAALEPSPEDTLSLEAVEIFLAIVGAEAGAMALRCLAKGGVYLAGGILPRLLKRVTTGGTLLEAFLMRDGRERFHQILLDTPLFVVTNTKAGIIGSREVALSLVRSSTQA